MSSRLEIVRLTPSIIQEIKARELEQTKRGALPLVYDHSMISTLQSCPRKGFLSYALHLKPRAMQKPLTFGSALHKAMEVFNKKFAERRKEIHSMNIDAQQEVLQKIKIEAIREYIKEARLDPDMPVTKEDELPYQPYSIERGHDLISDYIDKMWEHPLWYVPSPDFVELGIAILVGEYIYIGKIDLVVRLKSTNEYAIVDYKSTTKKDKNWGDQWNPHNQLTGYMRAVQEIFDVPVNKGFIQCLHFNKNIQDPVEFFPTTRSENDFIEWEEEMVRVIGQIEGMYLEWKERCREAGIDPEDMKALMRSDTLSSFPKNTSHCNFWRKPCEYTAICAAGGGHKRFLSTGGYVKKPWLPYEELGNRGTGVIY